MRCSIQDMKIIVRKTFNLLFSAHDMDLRSNLWTKDTFVVPTPVEESSEAFDYTGVPGSNPGGGHGSYPKDLLKTGTWH